MNAETFRLFFVAQSIGSAQSVPSNGRLLIEVTASSRRMRGEIFSRMNRLEKPMMWYSDSVAAVTSAIAALASRADRHEPAIGELIEPLTSSASSIGLPTGS